MTTTEAQHMHMYIYMYQFQYSLVLTFPRTALEVEEVSLASTTPSHRACKQTQNSISVFMISF